ncbi:hypothetical protein [Amycolatopsis vastitatis]|nr:hypothetical protein [Amycolatopsis vastitatis]
MPSDDMNDSFTTSGRRGPGHQPTAPSRVTQSSAEWRPAAQNRRNRLCGA